jgi:hypothetical protein
MSTNAVFEQLLRTRILVAAIGERLPTPWWRTEFLSTTGLRIGQRIFPRSFVRAAVTSATVAACRDHDINTGRRSFHLFRFPAHLERHLNGFADKLNNLSIPSDYESLLTELSIIQSSATVQAASGPKSLGPVEAVPHVSVPSTLASLYLDAARTGKRVYPYFEAVDDE